MRSPDIAYYRRRLTEELERSFDAKTEAQRRAHRDFAELYRARIAEAPPVSRASLAARSPAA